MCSLYCIYSFILKSRFLGYLVLWQLEALKKFKEHIYYLQLLTTFGIKSLLTATPQELPLLDLLEISLVTELFPPGLHFPKASQKLRVQPAQEVQKNH